MRSFIELAVLHYIPCSLHMMKYNDDLSLLIQMCEIWWLLK